MMASRYLIGKDGKTPYERRRGRTYKMEVVPFGESIWYKAIRGGKAQKDKLDSEWHKGIWFGHNGDNNEMAVGADRGSSRHTRFRERRKGERWDTDKIEAMMGTPDKPDPNKEGVGIPIMVHFDEGHKEEVKGGERGEEVAGRMYVTDDVIRKYGMTGGCEGCAARRSGMRKKASHSQTCRERIMDAMEGDEEGRRRRRYYDERERVDSKMAAQIEREGRRMKKQTTERQKDETRDGEEGGETEHKTTATDVGSMATQGGERGARWHGNRVH